MPARLARSLSDSFGTQADYDAVVVGAGPNGLSAAIELARSGRSVLVVEASETIGGGCSSEELTAPGFVHDVCSAIHPLARASPFFRSLPLDRYGVKMIDPQIPLAHPLPDGSAAVMFRSLGETAARLGKDGRRYARLFGPLVRNADGLVDELLGPLKVPRHPLAMARFGLSGLRSATRLTDGFRSEAAKALFAGSAAHSVQRLEAIPTAAVGLVLGMLGHAYGWPVIEGGSQRLADALGALLRDLGGEVVMSARVGSIAELPRARAVLFDTVPKHLAAIAGDVLPRRYRDRLLRFRHGPGVFKIDWAIDGEVPWTAPECRVAGTVHVGGTVEEIALGERDAWNGRVPERPLVLVAQQSVCDPSRAPAGRQAVWAYCHVPHASGVDMTDRIEAQIERFAPGFRDTIVERHVMSPAAMEAHDANYVGGDIGGGTQDLRQLFTRPVARFDPYTTPNESIFICSSSTPPGGGVHGMCGFYAAQAALRGVLG